MYRYLLILMLGLLPVLSSAQNVMMQAWYWDYPKKGCNGYPMGGSSWAATLNGKVTELKNAGYTHLWLPPLSKASFGDCSNGYDPKDLYDYGQYSGQTGFGTGMEVSGLVNSLNANNMKAVADVVYNHRDGGAPETNPAVKDYVGGTNGYGTSGGGNPFPNDRYRIVLPIGGATGLGAGTYYFKFSSKSDGYGNVPYVIYTNTNTYSGNYTTANENEPNGGGGCSEPSNVILLNQDFSGSIDNMGCKVDELSLIISSSDFNAAGDEIKIFVKAASGYHDLRPYEVWYNGNNIVNQLQYQTYTNFNQLPSNQGGMNFESFRPNSNSVSVEKLNLDWNSMLFFYDYDQAQTSTRNTLNAWTKWLWTDLGIRGYRMDAVKHFDPVFVSQLMNYLNAQSPSIQPDLVVGELFDYGADNLKNWVDQASVSVPSSINVRAFDFALAGALRNACENPDQNYDRRAVLNAGMVRSANSSPFTAITFANNHDFRKNDYYNNDPLLAYAYILTNNQIGLPCVFYPDYYGATINMNEDNPPVNIIVPSLKNQIDELMSVHKNYIAGATAWTPLSLEWMTYNQDFSGTSFANPWNFTLAYQLKGTLGGKDVLVVLNFGSSTLHLNQKIQATAGLPVNSTMAKIAGPAAVPSSITVNGSGIAQNIQIPARSYGIWVSGAALPVTLTTFEATGKQKSVQLTWAADTEDQFAGYEVQRSLDGQSYRKIAWVDAKGTAGGPARYELYDNEPAFNQPVYYRLRMVDLDGTAEFSPIRSVTLQQKPEAVLFPNPSKGQFFIRFEEAVQAGTQLEIFDALGRSMARKILEEGTLLEEVSLDGAENGVYRVRVTKAGQVVFNGVLHYIR